jgi:3-deoxy-D-manno-oct-2-ulosonic acid (Kdo) hydroxylase
MAILSIPKEALLKDASQAGSFAEQQREWCRRLEAGDILFFPETPLQIPADDLAFLLGQQQTASSLHKNIAYKPGKDLLTGVDSKSMSPEMVERLHAVMRDYSRSVTQFLLGFLAPYQGRWDLDYTSFRPLEEQGRDLPLHRRNDLLHTDAFPTRPTHGARILRFFNNIHPTRTRDWITCEPFGTIIGRYAPEQIPLPQPKSATEQKLSSLAKSVGLGRAIPSLKRSPYDEFMLRFHNFLKENSGFQASSGKMYTQFPPGSSWMVYTDTVPHAVLAGQYALEQTFLVSAEAQVDPQSAPVAILEQMTGTRLR